MHVLQMLVITMALGMLCGLVCSIPLAGPVALLVVQRGLSRGPKAARSTPSTFPANQGTAPRSRRSNGSVCILVLGHCETESKAHPVRV